jgi:hypothetical protein
MNFCENCEKLMPYAKKATSALRGNLSMLDRFKLKEKAEDIQ